MSGIYGLSSTSYTPLLLSHQTGLSVTGTTANTFYAIGSAISVPRNGIMVMSAMGYISAGTGGYIQLKLTRGSDSYLFGNTTQSLFANDGEQNISSTTVLGLTSISLSSGYGTGNGPFILPVYSGDSLQLYGASATAGDVVYLTDVLVILI